MARAYGVTDAEKKSASRWTFYIGADGKILSIDKDVKTATHADRRGREAQGVGRGEEEVRRM